MCDGLSKKKKRSILSRAKRLLAADIVHDATHKIKFFLLDDFSLYWIQCAARNLFARFQVFPWLYAPEAKGFLVNLEHNNFF